MAGCAALHPPYGPLGTVYFSKISSSGFFTTTGGGGSSVRQCPAPQPHRPRPPSQDRSGLSDSATPRKRRNACRLSEGQAAANARPVSPVVSRSSRRAALGAAQQFRPAPPAGGPLGHLLACLSAGREFAGPRPADDPDRRPGDSRSRGRLRVFHDQRLPDLTEL